MKWSKEIKWNKNDVVVTLYFHKHGVIHLSPIKSEIELAENVIGSTLDMFRIQSNLVGNIVNKKEIDTPSKLQKTVIEEFNDMTEKELRKEVIQIINDPERKVIVEERTKLRKEKEIEDKKKEDKKKLDAIFRKMGKDPSKMKFVGIRPVEPVVETEEIEEVEK